MYLTLWQIGNYSTVIMKFKGTVSLSRSPVGTCMNILLSLRGPHSCVLFTTI